MDSSSEDEVNMMLELLESHSVSILSDADALFQRSQYLQDAETYIVEHNVRPETFIKYQEKMLSYKVQVNEKIGNQESNRSVRHSSQTLVSACASKDDLNSQEMDEEKKKQDEIAKTQKMFPKIPKTMITTELSKQELMRLSAAYELVGTEIDYVKDLSAILHVCHHNFRVSDF